MAKRTDRSPDSSGPSYAELLGLSLMLAVAVVVPVIVAWRIGAALGQPLPGAVVGVLLGIVAAGLTVYSRLRRYW